MRVIASILALTAGALGSACLEDSTAPQVEGLRLEGATSRSTIGVGDTASIVFRLRNLRPYPITLTFSTGCQILPYITGKDRDQIVYPGGGGWVCPGVITKLTLSANGEKLNRVQIRGGTLIEAVYPQVPLAPGEYLAYATLAHPLRQLRS